MAKLTVKQSLDKALIHIMRRPALVWMSPTTLIGDVIIDPACPTACTNGRDVIYGAQFIEQLSFKQVLATVLHENLHKMLMHLIMFQYLHAKYDPTHPGIVNIAMDMVINRILKGLGDEVEMWDGIIDYCYDRKYDDENVWDVPHILNDLLKNPPPPPPPRGKPGDPGDKKGGGQPGKPGDGKPQPEQGGKAGKQSHDEHDWAGAKKLSQEELETLGKEIEEAIRQGQTLSKHMSGNVPRTVGDMLVPVIDWTKALRDFLTERVKGGVFQTFSRPNRRFLHTGQYRPSRYDEAVKGILFAVDMSGSVGPQEVREVLTELGSCIETIKPESVDIIYWDTQVVRHEHYAGEDAKTCINSTKPEGGGGTTPSCVIPFCQQRNIKPAVVVWLSDGCVGGDWAEALGIPAFWMITSGGQAPSHLPHAKLPVRL